MGLLPLFRFLGLAIVPVDFEGWRLFRPHLFVGCQGAVLANNCREPNAFGLGLREHAPLL